MNEEWKGVVGHESDYLISSFGRVVSTRCSTPRLLIGGMIKGYPTVTLMLKSGQKTTTVHRLVAKAFLEKPEGINVVNHKDGDKTNNHVSNLEWCTYGYNNFHAHNTGLKNQIVPVVAIPKKGIIGYYFPSQAKAALDGFHQGHVSAACLGKIKSHAGFLWRSLENRIDGIMVNDCACIA